MGKVMLVEEALEVREEARRKGKKVVFTNGVFDLLHVGHLDYLTKSKQMAISRSLITEPCIFG